MTKFSSGGFYRVENLMKLTEPSTAFTTPATSVGLLASTAAAEQLAKLHKDLSDKIASAGTATVQEEPSEPFI